MSLNQRQDDAELTTFPFKVYLGRGNGLARKLGNKIYRQTIKETKPIYRGARGNKAKAKVAKDLIRFIQNQGGTFYHKVGFDKYEEAPSTVVLLKVKQALREKFQSSSRMNALDTNDDTNPQIKSILKNIVENIVESNCGVQEEQEEQDAPPALTTAKGRVSIIDYDNSALTNALILQQPEPPQKAPPVFSRKEEENITMEVSANFDEHSFLSNDSSFLLHKNKLSSSSSTRPPSYVVADALLLEESYEQEGNQMTMKRRRSNTVSPLREEYYAQEQGNQTSRRRNNTVSPAHELDMILSNTNYHDIPRGVGNQEDIIRNSCRQHHDSPSCVVGGGVVPPTGELVKSNNNEDAIPLASIMRESIESAPFVFNTARNTFENEELVVPENSTTTATTTNDFFLLSSLLL